MKRLIQLLAFGSTAFGLFASAQAAVETYQIDPVHSSVGFAIRHTFGRVPGVFTKFTGTIVVDRDNLEKSSVEAAVDVASVDTRTEKRDNHLRSPDFFDAVKFPAISFTSTAWKKTGENTFDVTGDLTIKNVTKSVVLNVNLLGFGPGMQGAMVSGWEATTKLNRRDFGVNGPAMLGNIVGDEVAVTITVEADLQK